MKAQAVDQFKKRSLLKQLELKITPPAQALICMGCMKLLSLSEVHFTLSKGFYGFLYIATLGGFFGFWALIDCYRNRTTINPQKPNKTKRLIVSGAFRYSRNPMYLGLYIAILGWGIYLGNLWSILFSISFPLSITILQILPEERALYKRFGSRYQEYLQEVRRWI